MNNTQITSANPTRDIGLDQYSSITPEYELKANNIAPSEGVFDFTLADRVVDWALDNGMQVRGHTLLWHEATPDYFLQGSRNEIRARLETYISTVMEHFRGRIRDWDVINEFISVDLYRGDDGVGPDRQTNWLEAVGNADFLDWALLAARAADPDARLFINDYQTEEPRKQGWLIDMLRRFQDRNVPIDGVGHQFHLQLNTDPNAVLGAIDAVDNEFMGLVNHVTEMDVNFYQDPGSCWETQTNCQPDIGPVAPDEMLADQARMLRTIFDGLVSKPSVESVSFWGVRDSDSWLNLLPVERFNYPLLFDRDGEPKPAFRAITDPNYEI